ncbi:VATPase [Giardia lamblia P15]|uniref:VATPase n=1 Tax=Giardia intestinalis (strain P15) TaxID=658858 RepID=E1EXU0_GIAIA|nr:VATPase [Giardia lamblia P15]
MANIGILADEATITGFLLAGAGCISSGNQKNFYVVDQNMSKADVEAAFEELRNNPDISIVMVSNGVMETIKDTIAEYDLQGKVVMPFPTKDSGLFAS